MSVTGVLPPRLAGTLRLLNRAHEENGSGAIFSDGEEEGAVDDHAECGGEVSESVRMKSRR